MSVLITLVMVQFAAGNKPPGQLAAKGPYMEKDIQRLAEYYKVPVQNMRVSYFKYCFI